MLGSGNDSSSTNSDGGSNFRESHRCSFKSVCHSEKARQDHSTPRNFEEVNSGIVHSDTCDQATRLIRAKVNAAKSDGRLDDQEQAKITGNLGIVTEDEIEFVKSELAKP